MHRILFGLAAVASLAALTACGSAPSAAKTGAPKTGRSLRWPKPPAMTINPSRTYIADFKTTAGNFAMTLFAKTDPRAVNNFVFLARHRFFDGDVFFRVIRGFMVQTGDPLNTGTGGPGYSVKATPPAYPYAPRIVAMAHTSYSTSYGSQFFICTGAECDGLNQPQYNTYSELGRISKGFSVVEKIAAGKVTYNPKMKEVSKPVHPVRIEAVTVHVAR